MKRVAIAFLLVSATLVATTIAWSSWGHRQARDQAAEAEDALAMSSQAVKQIQERSAQPAPTDPAVRAARRADRLVAEAEADRSPRDH